MLCESQKAATEPFLIWSAVTIINGVRQSHIHGCYWVSIMMGFDDRANIFKWQSNWFQEMSTEISKKFQFLYSAKPQCTSFLFHLRAERGKEKDNKHS